jgi:DNA-binding XRE family transcriptional regulator
MEEDPWDVEYAPPYHGPVYLPDRIIRKDDPWDNIPRRVLNAAALAIDLLEAGSHAYRRRKGGSPGRTIRALRRGTNLTQAQLAKAAGIRQPTLSAIESERSDPHWSVIVRLLDAMDLVPVLHAHDRGRYPLRCAPDD